MSRSGHHSYTYWNCPCVSMQNSYAAKGSLGVWRFDLVLLPFASVPLRRPKDQSIKNGNFFSTIVKLNMEVN